MADNIKKKLGEVIDAHKYELCQMSDKIFDLAEISGEEYKTSEMLCKYLEKMVVQVNVEPGLKQHSGHLIRMVRVVLFLEYL